MAKLQAAGAKQTEQVVFTSVVKKVMPKTTFKRVTRPRVAVVR